MDAKGTFFDSKIELDKKHEDAIKASRKSSLTFRLSSLINDNTLYGVTKSLVKCLKGWNDYKDWFNKQGDTGKVNIGIFEGVVGTFNGLFSGTKSAEQKKFAKAIRKHIDDLGVVEKNIDKYKKTHKDKEHKTQCGFFDYVLGIHKKTVNFLTDLEAWYK